MITDELYERGLGIRHEKVGAEGADAPVESTTDFTDKLQEIVTRNCFGDIWSRPGWTRRERSAASRVVSPVPHPMSTTASPEVTP